MLPTTSSSLHSQIATSRKRVIVAGLATAAFGDRAALDVGEWGTLGRASGAGCARRIGGREVELRSTSAVGCCLGEPLLESRSTSRQTAPFGEQPRPARFDHPRSRLPIWRSLRRRLRAGLPGRCAWVCAFGTFSGGGTSRPPQGIREARPPRQHPRPLDPRPPTSAPLVPTGGRSPPPTPDRCPTTCAPGPDRGRSPPPTPDHVSYCPRLWVPLIPTNRTALNLLSLPS